MNTEFIKADDSNGIDRAALILKNGGLVAIPTETVYGLAADALNGEAVAKIFKAKGRPMDNPLIVHISRFDEIYRLVREVPEKAKALAEKYWPGPMTIILPKSDIIPKEVSAGLDTVAIRMPSHPTAKALIEKSGCPLAAPSANTSGLPSPTTAKHVLDDMNGKIDAIVDGGECAVGIESTVVTLATNPSRLLRPGGITHEQLCDVLGEVEIDKAVLAQLEAGVKPSSPGMKYKHYAPKAEVSIIKGSLPEYLCYIDAVHEDGDMALCFDTDKDKINIPYLTFGSENHPEEQANKLFSALREFDEMGAKRVFVRAPSSDGVGLGVYNRLLRSAAFRVINAPKIFGLTGQTGAGKTTVAKHLEQKNYFIIDGDILAREIVEKGSPVLKKLADTFGNDILDENENLIRSALAEKAFSCEENRQKLNSITHPAITEKALRIIKENFDKNYKGFIIDAAAIFDSKLADYCDKMIVVLADYETRKKRIIARDGIDENTADLRINAQPNDQYYIDRADILVRNYGEFTIDSELKSL